MLCFYLNIFVDAHLNLSTIIMYLLIISFLQLLPCTWSFQFFSTTVDMFLIFIFILRLILISIMSLTVCPFSSFQVCNWSSHFKLKVECRWLDVNSQAPNTSFQCVKYWGMKGQSHFEGWAPSHQGLKAKLISWAEDRAPSHQGSKVKLILRVQRLSSESLRADGQAHIKRPKAELRVTEGWRSSSYREAKS